MEKSFLNGFKTGKWRGLALSSVLIFTFGAAAYSYLSDGDTATNRIVIGTVQNSVVEKFDPPEKLEPGTSFTKDVKVENTGTADNYVRIKAVFTDSDMKKYCTVDWNDTDYIYNEEDGFWYYPQPLKAGESTPSLFTTITVSDEIPENQIKEFDVLVYTEAVQARTFDSYTQAWETYKANANREGA